MRNLLKVALLLGAMGFVGYALAQVTDRERVTRVHYSGQLTTDAVPVDAGAGMSLVGISAYRVTLCVEPGQTLSGAGSLEAYYFDYSQTDAGWHHNDDLDEIVTNTSVRCQHFPDRQVLIPSGRVFYRTNGTTMSGDDAGAVMDVYIKGWLKGQ